MGSGRDRRGRRRGWRDCDRARWLRAACESRSRRRVFLGHFTQALFQGIKCEIALVARDGERRAKAERIIARAEYEKPATEGELDHAIAEIGSLLFGLLVTHQLH